MKKRSAKKPSYARLEQYIDSQLLELSDKCVISKKGVFSKEYFSVRIPYELTASEIKRVEKEYSPYWDLVYFSKPDKGFVFYLSNDTFIRLTKEVESQNKCCHKNSFSSGSGYELTQHGRPFNRTAPKRVNY